MRSSAVEPRFHCVRRRAQRSRLIPEAGVQFFARLFRPLFTPAVVVAALGGLIVSDV